MWQIDFVNEKAVNEFLLLAVDIRAKMPPIIKMLEIYGNTLCKPHTAPLEKGFLKSGQNLVKVLQEVFIVIKVVKKF